MLGFFWGGNLTTPDPLCQINNLICTACILWYTTFMGRKNLFYLGPNPCEEECADMHDYSAHVAEVRRYVQMLNDRFINVPESAWFGIKREDGSDYGTYYEAVVYYLEDDEEASNFALFVESNCPMTWNDTEKIDWKKGAPAGWDTVDTSV